MASVIREVRGIPLWAIRGYLEELGGRTLDEAITEGDGWSARLEPIEDFRVGSLAVGQVRLTLEGDDVALLALTDRLDAKLLRAGG